MAEIKTMVAVPCMESVKAGFFMSYMTMRQVGKVITANTESSMIYTSRQILAKTALDLGADRILWLDSDMKFNPDLMERLSADLDEGREFVSGLYFYRVLPVKPVIYKDGQNGKPVPYEDYPRDAIFPITGCGFGAVMMTTALYARVKARYDEPFEPIKGLGEDLAFCSRARSIGAKLYCDSRVKLLHIGKYEYGEEDYDD